MGEILNYDSPLFHHAAVKHHNEGSDGVQLPNLQYILDTLVGSLATEGCCSKINNYEPRRKGQWKIVSPIDSILSNINQAEVRVLSDLSLALGNTRDERRCGQVLYDVER